MRMINLIICDDEKDIHENIKKSLDYVRDDLFNYAIIQDFYGTDDLKRFLRNYQQSDASDTVLLLDVLFNGRPDGLQALDNIRLHCPTMPIIILTACDDDRTFSFAKAKYNIEYVQKPVKSSDLRFRIESAIEKMKEPNIKDRISNLEKKVVEIADFVKNDMLNLMKEKK